MKPTLSIALLAILPLIAQPPLAHAQTAGHDALRGRTVTLSVSLKDGGQGSCLGLRINDPFAEDREVILTAAHCVTDADRIVARSLAGDLESVDRWLFWGDIDVAFILTSPPRLVAGYGPFRSVWPSKDQNVVAMISIGGGEPTPSAGLILDIASDRITVVMPGGPGTSGASVFTTDGNFIGMVSQGVSYPGNAGFLVNLVPAATIFRLFNQESTQSWLRGSETGTVTPAQNVPPAQNVLPTMTGHWAVVFQLTKGNDKDRARIPKGVTLECVQNVSTVICHATDNPGFEPFNGTLDQYGSVAFQEVDTKLVWAVPGVGWCTAYGCYAVGPHARQDRMTWRWSGQFQNAGLIEGTWTGFLFVGLGKYAVEGTWKAIRIQ